MRGRDKRRLRNCTSITRFRIWWCRRLRTGLTASFRILRWAREWRKSSKEKGVSFGVFVGRIVQRGRKNEKGNESERRVIGGGGRGG